VRQLDAASRRALRGLREVDGEEDVMKHGAILVVMRTPWLVEGVPALTILDSVQLG
jgi:hypothetical protein